MPHRPPHIMDTPQQDDDADGCPDDLREAVRATFSMCKRTEEAVTGKRYDPVNFPGLLREVATIKADLHAHMIACGANPKPKKNLINKVWLASMAAGGVAIFSTLGHFIGKGITAIFVAGGTQPPAHP